MTQKVLKNKNNNKNKPIFQFHIVTVSSFSTRFFCGKMNGKVPSCGHSRLGTELIRCRLVCLKMNSSLWVLGGGEALPW